MKFNQVVTNVVYLLIMSFFLYDSYTKLTELSKEADILRSKYQQFQDFLARYLAGFQFPLDQALVANNSTLIVGVTASIQAAVALLVILGQK